MSKTDKKVNSYKNGKLGSKAISVVIFIIMVTIIVDTSIVRISAFTGGLGPAESTIVLFSGMAVVFGMGQHFIMKYLKTSKQDQVAYDILRVRIHKVVSITLYALIAIFVALILQMVFTSSYNALFLHVIVCLNYFLGIALLGFLSHRFLSWFKTNHNLVVLTYGLAIMGIAVNAIFTVLYVNKGLISAERSSLMIYPDMILVANYTSVYDAVNSAYFITSVLSFILTWIATVLLLRSYYSRFGRGKYWILVSVPMVYFLSQFQPIFLDILAPARLSNPILFGIFYTLFFSATIPAGGLLFGMAFWSAARNMSSVAVKEYMLISAYGIILLFCSNQASGLVLVPYPPFGLATISFFGLSSYLIYVGIYSSAMSVAQDSELRKSIRGVAINEPRLLDSIGSAEMEQQILKKAIAIGKLNQNKMTEETGIQSSLTEEDMKQYLEQVMKEVTKKKQE